MTAEQLVLLCTPVLPTRSMEWLVHALCVAVAVRGVHRGMDPLTPHHASELAHTTRFYAVWRFVCGVTGVECGRTEWVDSAVTAEVDSAHPLSLMRCCARVRIE
jgi:hypothetical protein